MDWTKIDYFKNVQNTVDGWFYYDRPPNVCEMNLALKVKRIMKLDKSQFIFNERRVLDGLELDIWIPSQGLALEYQGPLHYPTRKAEDNIRERDSFKKRLCRQKGIKLHEVAYFMDTLSDVKSILKRGFSNGPMKKGIPHPSFVYGKMLKKKKVEEQMVRSKEKWDGFLVFRKQLLKKLQ